MDIHKIPQITWVTAILGFIAVLCPGAMFIFLFNRDLFLLLDATSISLLSLSISSPLWIINTLIFMGFAFSDSAKRKETDLQISGMMGSLLSIIAIYTPILLKFFVGITLRTGVIITLSIEVIFILFVLIEYKLDARKRKKAVK